MKWTIIQATNGFVVKAYDNEVDLIPLSTYVYSSTNSSDVAHIKDMLCDLIELVGASGGRYDRERLYVRIEPGDKYEA